MPTPIKPPRTSFVMPSSRRETTRRLTNLINDLTAVADQLAHLLPEYPGSTEAEAAFRRATDAALGGLTYALNQPA